MVARSLDPANRRSMRVELTPDGRRAVDAAVAEHVANEQRLLEPLTPADRAELDRLLRTLLGHLGTDAG
jgi:DNA-binding MarR family transcriptional regulator